MSSPLYVNKHECGEAAARGRAVKTEYAITESSAFNIMDGKMNFIRQPLQLGIPEFAYADSYIHESEFPANATR